MFTKNFQENRRAGLDRYKERIKERNKKLEIKHNKRIEEIYSIIMPELIDSRGSNMITHKLINRISFAELARRYNLTRERIRQIIQQECSDLGIDFELIKEVKPFTGWQLYKEIIKE